MRSAETRYEAHKAENVSTQSGQPVEKRKLMSSGAIRKPNLQEGTGFVYVFP
jgi:hypothetical protein